MNTTRRLINTLLWWIKGPCNATYLDVQTNDHFIHPRHSCTLPHGHPGDHHYAEDPLWPDIEHALKRRTYNRASR